MPPVSKTPPPPPPEPLTDEPKVDARMKLILSLVIVAVIFLELILFVLWLPSPKTVGEAVASAVDQRLNNPIDYSLNAPVNEVNPVLPPDQVERPLGEGKFKTTATSPTSPDRIESFEVGMFARINKGDATKWDALYLNNQQTIRQEVNLVLRQAKPEYKLDPKLTVIRNSIRVRINEMFGHGYIQQVICVDPVLNVM